jgi:hypothetical protein
MQYLKSIYLQLIRELTLINCSTLLCIDRTELSFQASLVAFQKLNLGLQQKEWQRRQLICINKKIRAEIISLAEFFLLLHQALLFEPPDQEQAIHYWWREQKRLADFRRTYTAFYKYYKSGKSDKDNLFFKCPSLHYFPGNNCCQPSGDVLQGKLQALLLYNAIVTAEIVRLKKCNPKNNT